MAGVIALVVLSAGLHCSATSCSIRAADYDRSCKQDSDCVPVFDGSFCGGNACTCENAAINVGAQAQYWADLDGKNPPRCPCPSPPAVTCVQGTCALASFAFADAGSD